MVLGLKKPRDIYVRWCLRDRVTFLRFEANRFAIGRGFNFLKRIGLLPLVAGVV
jgi:hypothetical protein